MNFSAGLSLFTNLVLKMLGSVFGCHTNSSIQICNTVSFSNLAAMILVQRFSITEELNSENYITHTWKSSVGISPI